MEEIKNLLVKYRQVILYLIFGAATTAVNLIAYMVCAQTIDLATVPSTACAWLIAVLFAYFTNRKWVFESKADSRAALFQEFTSFISCRLLSGVLDVFLMWLFVDVIGAPELLIKIVSNVFVVVINYVASKFLIFKKQ